MGKRGHNAIKGKQGFQPVRQGPPTSIRTPLRTTQAETDVIQQQYLNNQLRRAEVAVPKGYIHNYTWQNAVLADIKTPRGRPGHTPDGLAERIGSRIVLAAYGKELARLSNKAEPHGHQHAYLVTDLAQLISRDSSRTYPPRAFASAMRITRMSDDPQKLENALFDPTRRNGWSAMSQSIVDVAVQERNGVTEADEEIIAYYTSEAENQCVALSDTLAYSRAGSLGKGLSRSPAPSRELVRARKDLLTRKWEKRQSEGSQPSRTAKLEREIAELEKTVAKLEKEY